MADTILTKITSEYLDRLAQDLPHLNFANRKLLIRTISGIVTLSSLPSEHVASLEKEKSAPVIISQKFAAAAKLFAQLKPKLPVLSAMQLEAIRQKAETVKWADRGNYAGTPFDWVKEHYGEWIPGLLQSHFKADIALYGAFAQRVKRQGLPEWLDVPSEPDARLREVTSAEELQQLLAGREYQNSKTRRHRSKKLASKLAV